jgi:hypothetical protein
MMKNISFLGLCVIAIIITAGIAYAVKSPISPKNAQATKLKPDIVITDVQVHTNDSSNFLITAAVINSVRSTSPGPFEVRLYWRIIPRTAPQYSSDPDFLADIPWNYVNSWRVENLFNDPSTRLLPSFTLRFVHTTPAEQLESDRYVYRLTADEMNQVDEAREDNNINGGTYPPYYWTTPDDTGSSPKSF